MRSCFSFFFHRTVFMLGAFCALLVAHASAFAGEHSYTTETLCYQETPGSKRLAGVVHDPGNRPRAFREVGLVGFVPNAEKRHYDLYRCWTDKEGKFDAGYVPAGRYRLLCITGERGGELVTVVADGTSQDITLSEEVFYPDAPQGSATSVSPGVHYMFPLTTIRGRCVYSDTRLPAPNVSLLVIRAGYIGKEDLPPWVDVVDPFCHSGKGKTDEKGNFEISDCPLGNVILCTSGDESTEGQVLRTRTVLGLPKEVGDVTVENNCGICFRLMDPVTRSPVYLTPRTQGPRNLEMGIRTTAGKNAVAICSQPDKEGRVTIENIPVTSDEILIQHNQYVPKIYKVDREKIRAKTQPDIGDIQLDPGRRVRFILEYPSDAKKIPMSVAGLYHTKRSGPDSQKATDKIILGPEGFLHTNFGETDATSNEIVMSGFLPGTVIVRISPVFIPRGIGSPPLKRKLECDQQTIRVEDQEETVVKIPLYWKEN